MLKTLNFIKKNEDELVDEAILFPENSKSDFELMDPPKTREVSLSSSKLPQFFGGAMSTESVKSDKSMLISPEKAIKAVKSHKATSSKELSFRKGEFFFVVDEDSTTYTATNPVFRTKGRVPKHKFEEFKKGCLPPNWSGPDSKDPVDSVMNKFQSLFAVVLFDFTAEKYDELTASAGQELVVLAHHNCEWFVAKPVDVDINPGLIPVDFVSLVDKETKFCTGNSVKEDIEQFHLPSVDDWKNALLEEYERKANEKTAAEKKAMERKVASEKRYSPKTVDMTPKKQITTKLPSNEDTLFNSDSDSALSSFKIKSVKFDDKQYWFKVTARYENHDKKTLKRYLQDFHEVFLEIQRLHPEYVSKLNGSGKKWNKYMQKMLLTPNPVLLNEMEAFECKSELAKLLIKISEIRFIFDSPTIASFLAVKDNGFDKLVTEDGLRSEVRSTNKSDSVQSTPKTPSNFISNTFPNLTSSKLFTPKKTPKGDETNLFDVSGGYSVVSSPDSSKTNAQFNHDSKVRVKVYHNNDIFALLVNENITVKELRKELAQKINLKTFRLSVKLLDGVGEDITNDEQLQEVMEARMKLAVFDE